LAYFEASNQLTLYAITDAGGWTNVGSGTLPDSTNCYVEFSFRAATAAGANNGIARMWIDGSLACEATNIDNDANSSTMSKFYVGKRDLSGVVSGTFFVDEIVMTDDYVTEIGPVVPPVGDTFTIKVKDPPSGHAALFAVDDVLRAKAFNGTEVVDNWMTVVSVTDPGGSAAYFEYEVELQSGTPGTFPAGAAIVNYGQSGDGLIKLTSDEAGAPFIEVATHAGEPWTTITQHVRMGNLNGGWGYAADAFGLAIGEYASGKANLTMDPTNGLRLRIYDATVIQLDNSGGASITGVLAIGTSGGIYQGTGTFASPTTGLKMWNDSGVGRIGGYASGVLQWYADSDGVLRAGAGSVQLNATGITLDNGTGAVNQVKWVDDSDVVIGRINAQQYEGEGVLTLCAPKVGLNATAVTLHLGYNDGIPVTYPFELQLDSTIELGIDTSTLLTPLDVRVGGGLYVGSTGTNPAAGTVVATDFMVALGGVHVGGTSDPGTDNLVVDGYANVTDYVAASGGVHVGGTSDPGTDNILIDGLIQVYRNSSTYTGRVYVQLSSPTVIWDASASKSTGTYNIYFSTMSLPSSVKAVEVHVRCKWSSANNGYYVHVRPYGTSIVGPVICKALVANFHIPANGMVNCSSEGNIEAVVVGASAEDAYLEITGYYL
jgi:hypothetical protein